MKKLTAILILAMLLCSCGGDGTAEMETNAAETTEIAADTSTTAETAQTAKQSEQTTETSIQAHEETAAVKTEEVYGDFEYQPPQEVIDTHFYCDDVETKIMVQNASNEDFDIFDIFNDPEVEKAMHKSFAENLPQEVVDDMTQNIQFPDWLSDMNLKITAMGYMKYDFNSDGKEDYYVVANLDDKSEVEGYLYMQTFYSFDRIYISEDSGFVSITIPSFEDTRNSVHSILSTETNGMKDLLAFCNSNAPSLKYDGVSAYGDFTESDERHTFLEYEIISGNILHINMNISVIDAPLGEYYTAIKVADNPYIKNNVLYTCYPDGTPRTYTQKPFGESLPTDFAASIDGYDFYVELTDEEAKYNKISLDILEIKYIGAE